MFTLPLYFPAVYGLNAYLSTCSEIPDTLVSPLSSEIQKSAILNRLEHSLLKSYLQDFLNDQGIRKDLIIREIKNPGFCGASGTNYFTNGVATILAAPGLFLTDRDAFGWVMKHEICHIKNNDHFTIYLVPAICSFAALIFANYMMLPVSLIFIITLVVAKISLNMFSQYREGKADDFAIEHGTTQELIGGRRFIKSFQMLNIKSWEFGDFIRFSSNGENRFDFMHPSVSSRLQKIEKELIIRGITIPDLQSKEESIKMDKIKQLFNQ